MKVSVCVPTYNHVHFIEQCLDSILMQQADFDYEILIGEDDSTDGTREICIEYAKKTPHKIRLFLNDRRNVIYINGYPTGRWNLVNLMKNAKGQYIALCEGDDYWTDSLKLKKQFEFLEMYQDFVLCCHPVVIEYSGNRQKFWDDVIGRWEQGSLTIEDFIGLPNRPEIPTASMFFRNLFKGHFPCWFYKVISGHIVICLLLAHRGKIGFFSNAMAIHRKHAGGISRLFETDTDFMDEQVLLLYQYFDRYVNYKYHRILAPFISEGLKRKAFIYQKKGKSRKAFHALWQFLTLKTGVPNELKSKEVVILEFVEGWHGTFLYRCARYLSRTRLVKALKYFFCPLMMKNNK